MAPRQWQTVLDKLVTEARMDGTLKKIENVYDASALIQIFMNEPYRKEMSLWIAEMRQDVTWMKRRERSALLRTEGNQKFGLRDYTSALELYTKSLRLAPVPSEEVYLALANRSAALFYLKEYKVVPAILLISLSHWIGGLPLGLWRFLKAPFENQHNIICCNDIDLYFAHEFPNNLHFKLYQRRGECLAHMGKHTDAIVDLIRAQEALNTVAQVTVKEKNFRLNQIENMIRHFTSLTLDSCLSNVEKNVPELPVPFLGCSEVLQYASKAVSIQLDVKKGRSVVANTDVSIGDVLFAEKPYASVLLREQYEFRCHHCYNIFKAPIPCWKCTDALYCKELCRTDSWKEYHQWECASGLFILNSMGIAHLGLRIFLKAASLHDFKALLTKLKNSEGEGIKQYYVVYQLLTHLTKMTVEDRASYTLTAVCLLLYLVNTTDFTKNAFHLDHDVRIDKPEYFHDFLFIGALILRHICQLVSNGHAITALQQKKLRVDRTFYDEEQVRIATAIFPSASLMNHSCDPNIINSFFGTHLIVKACKDIRRGEEVYNCYGPNFRRMRKAERKAHLQAQYKFDCTCEPCLSKEDFYEVFQSYLCTSCGGPIPNNLSDGCYLECLQCGTKIDNNRVYAECRAAYFEHKKGRVLLNKGCVKEALQCFLDSRGRFEKTLYKKHTDLRECVDNIAKCYALLADYSKSASIIVKETLPGIEEQFGSWSIEVAHELQKLTDVLGLDLKTCDDTSTFLKKLAEADKYIKRAKEIYTLNYGVWEPSLSDVIQKEEILKSLLTSYFGALPSDDVANPT